MADITIFEGQKKDMEQEVKTAGAQETGGALPFPAASSCVEGIDDEDTEDRADVNRETDAPKFLNLEDILGMDTAELTAEKQGHFMTEKLGAVPFTAISYDDYKQAKKDCVTYNQDSNGVIQTKVDDDKLMTKIIILAVDKDRRSNFTFANGSLLRKLGVYTAEGALGKLLSPGEIVNFAVEVQNASGFGTKAKKKVKESIKNS